MKPDVIRVFRSKSFIFHILPTLVVLCAFLAVTMWGWFAAKEALARENVQAINMQASQTEEAIMRRFSVYEEVLRGSVGLFAASNYVTHQDWNNYIGQFNLQKRYPGTVAVGYVAVVQGEGILAYQDELRQHGMTNFTASPAGAQATHAFLQYIVPDSDQNTRALGQDLYADPVRRAAMEKARDTAVPVISDRVRLLLDNSSSPQPGFAIYMPVYKGGSVPPSTEERRAQLVGYVYAPFRGPVLLSGIFRQEPQNVGFRIYSNNIDASKLLYTSKVYDSLAASPRSLSTIRQLEINGAKWIIDYKFAPQIVSTAVRNRPSGLLFAGGLFSILTAGLVLALLVARTRSLASLKEREVQSAKDDLLSLASHQLRTPATGVKQYIGMVLEGYAGQVKKEQRQYLEKAYASNERQLHIINDLLYVAKADAGRIVLAKREIRLYDLLKDIVAEQRQTARDKRLSLRLQVKQKDLTVYVDKHCLRMAIENLLSNAIKYTPEKGRIAISVESKNKLAFIGVQDNGVGITDKDLPRLFNRFTRIPNQLSTQASGSGIGLYLAKNLIELHGGKITVLSKPQKGTTFTVRLPLDDSSLNSGGGK